MVGNHHSADRHHPGGMADPNLGPGSKGSAEGVPRQTAGQHRLQSVVVTLGPHGCVYWDAAIGQSGVQPALKARVVDTCGAGDAFFSGTVTGLARGETLAQAVRLGTRVAACTIQSAENNCLALAQALENVAK